MTWFLRLFRAFRDIEAELRAVSDRRILLEDQVRTLAAEVTKANERADEARRETIAALKEYARRPETASAPMPPIRDLGVQGRARVHEGYAQFVAATNAFDELLKRDDQ